MGVLNEAAANRLARSVISRDCEQTQKEESKARQSNDEYR